MAQWSPAIKRKPLDKAPERQPEPPQKDLESPALPSPAVHETSGKARSLYVQSLKPGSGLPWWLRWERICFQCRRPGFDPWVRKTSWRRKWKPMPHSCLGNPIDRGACGATVHGVTKSQTRLKQLSIHARWSSGYKSACQSRGHGFNA